MKFGLVSRAVIEDDNTSMFEAFQGEKEPMPAAIRGSAPIANQSETPPVRLAIKRRHPAKCRIAAL
jgi:hypothetical protein